MKNDYKKPTSISLSPEVLEQAKTVAANQHRSLSAQIEWWIEQSLAVVEAAKQPKAGRRTGVANQPRKSKS